MGSCRIRSESFCRPYLHSTAALQNDLPLDMSKISKSKPLRIQAPHTTWPCNVSSRCIRRLKDVTIRGAVVPIPMSCESLRSSHGSFSGTGGVRFKSEQSSPPQAPSRTTTPVRTVNSPRGPSPSASFENSNARYPSRRSLPDSVSSRPETPNSTASGRSNTLVEGRLLLNDLDNEGTSKEHVRFVHFDEDRALLRKYQDLPLELYGQPMASDSPRRREASPQSPRDISFDRPRDSPRSPRNPSPKKKAKRPNHPPRRKLVKAFKSDKFEHSRIESCLQVYGQPARVAVEASEMTLENLQIDSRHTDESESGPTVEAVEAETDRGPADCTDDHSAQQTRTTPSLVERNDSQVPRSGSSWTGKAMGFESERSKSKGQYPESSTSSKSRDWKDVPVEIRGILRRVPSFGQCSSPSKGRRNQRLNGAANSSKDSTAEAALSSEVVETAEKISVEIQCSSDSEDDLDDTVWSTGRRRLALSSDCGFPEKIYIYIYIYICCIVQQYILITCCITCVTICIFHEPDRLSHLRSVASALQSRQSDLAPLAPP